MSPPAPAAGTLKLISRSLSRSERRDLRSLGLVPSKSFFVILRRKSISFFDLSQGLQPDDIVAHIARALAEQAVIDGAASDELFESSRIFRGHRLDAPRVLRRLLDLAKAGLGEHQLFLLFDGLDESAPAESRAIKQLIEDILQRGSFARVVVSSRAGATVAEIALSHRQRFFEFRMEPLSQVEAVEFVLRRFGNRSSGIARDVVDQIVEISEGLPLALQLLAAQFETTGSVSIPAIHTLALGQIAAAFRAVRPELASAEDLTLILQLIAIEDEITLDRLSRLTTIPRPRLQEIVTCVSAVSLDSFSDSVHFENRYVRESVLRSQVLAEAVSSDDLRFGDEAAERDTLLESRFIPRPDLARIESGDKTIVLGDRGAGKSALFRRLQSHESADAQQASILIATTDDPGTFVQQMTSDPKAATAEYFKAVWLLYCAAIGAKHVQTLLPALANETKYKRAAWTILRNVGWKGAIRDEPMYSRAWAGVRSVLPSSVGFTVGPVTVEPSWSGKRKGSAVEVTEFLDETDRILSKTGKRLILVFDQIDEVFKYERTVQEALVQGLFLAESNLSQSKALRIAVLLRTDLYEIYDIQEKNKLISRTIRLGWTERELLEMTRARIVANARLERIREITNLVDRRSKHGIDVVLRSVFPREVEGQEFVAWLFDGLRNGNQRVSPRQLIIFLNLARDRMEREMRGDGVRSSIPILSAKSVADAMTLLSELSYEEVVSDFRVAVSFVRSCRAAKKTEFEPEEVEGLFDAADGAPAQQIESLERLGFLERIVTGSDTGFVKRFRIPRLFTRCWEQRVD